MNENSATYNEFLRVKDGAKRSLWNCEVCDTVLSDADQYQNHLRGKPHERRLRLRAGNTKVPISKSLRWNLSLFALLNTHCWQ